MAAARARWSGPASTSGQARRTGGGGVMRARRARPRPPVVVTAVGGPSPDASPPFAWTDAWAPPPPARPTPTLAFVDLRHALVPYEAARAAQHDLVAAVRAAREEDEDEGGRGGGGGGARPARPPVGGALLLLQHPPVYTLGAGATTDHLRFDPAGPDPPPAPLHRVERGGEVTYHGPGQLVLYPVLDLSGAFLPDLHWYMRALEQVVIEALSSASGLTAGRLAGLTGVWCPPPPGPPSPAKLAAVGVRAAGWVSYHGVALNVTCDLAPFSHIVPCGIGDRPVGSVASALAAAGKEARGDATLLDAHADALVAAAGRVLAARVAPPSAVGGRVGAAASAVEAALRQAAAAYSNAPAVSEVGV